MKNILRLFFFMTCCFGLADTVKASIVIPEPSTHIAYTSLVDSGDDSGSIFSYDQYLRADDSIQSVDRLDSDKFLIKHDAHNLSATDTSSSVDHDHNLIVKLDNQFVGYEVDYTMFPYNTWGTPGTPSGDHGGKEIIKKILSKFIENRGHKNPTQTPVSPAVWLFGTGLVGIFGIRRKMNGNTDGRDSFPDASTVSSNVMNRITVKGGRTYEK